MSNGYPRLCAISACAHACDIHTHQSTSRTRGKCSGGRRGRVRGAGGRVTYGGAHRAGRQAQRHRAAPPAARRRQAHRVTSASLARASRALPVLTISVMARRLAAACAIMAWWCDLRVHRAQANCQRRGSFARHASVGALRRARGERVCVPSAHARLLSSTGSGRRTRASGASGSLWECGGRACCPRPFAR